MTEKSGAMQVDLKLVRQLAELLDETSLSEIEVEDGDRKIKVCRNPFTSWQDPIKVWRNPFWSSQDRIKVWRNLFWSW